MDEINFRNIPTEILLEEITRRVNVITERKARAQDRLTATAQAEGERLLFGLTSYSEQLGWKGIVCACLLCFGLFGAFAFLTLPSPYEYDVPVCLTIFVVGIAFFVHLWARTQHIVNAFKRRYPADAKLLGYI